MARLLVCKQTRSSAAAILLCWLLSFASCAACYARGRQVLVERLGSDFAHSGQEVLVERLRFVFCKKSP